jgi:protein phosphatase
MRLAVLSDIHGNLTALETVLTDVAAAQPDKVWVLGDLAAIGPRPSQCIRQVQALADTYGKDNVNVIRGNTDRDMVYATRHKRPVVENADEFPAYVADLAAHYATLQWNLAQLSFEDYTYLSKLPSETGVNVPGYGYVLGYHGIPGDDEGRLTPDTPDEEARDMLLDREGRLGIGAHIHVQMDRDLGAWRILNDGSVGFSNQNPGFAQWLLLTFDGGDVHVDMRNLPYDTAALAADMQAAGHPEPEWVLRKFHLL